MNKHTKIRPTVLAFVAACACAPLAAWADEPDPADFVVSQDARFHQGELIPADQVPAGIRTVSFEQFVAQQRRAGQRAPSFAAMFNSTGAWSIGVFR